MIGSLYLARKGVEPEANEISRNLIYLQFGEKTGNQDLDSSDFLQGDICFQYVRT